MLSSKQKYYANVYLENLRIIFSTKCSQLQSAINSLLKGINVLWHVQPAEKNDTENTGKSKKCTEQKQKTTVKTAKENYVTVTTQ